MRNLTLAICLAFFLWFITVISANFWDGYAMAFIVVIGLELRLLQKAKLGVMVLTISSLLIDINSPHALPLITLTSLAAGCTYITSLEKLLTHSTVLSQTLSMVLWLLLWRGWYVVMSALILTMEHRAVVITTAGLLTTWLYWLLAGLSFWALWRLLKSVAMRYAKR